MIPKQPHNRAICTGDRGGEKAPRLSKADKAKVFSARVVGIKARMEPWGTDFIRKVWMTSNSKAWQQAANEVLRERKAFIPARPKYVPPEVREASKAKAALGERPASRRWGLG